MPKVHDLRDHVLGGDTGTAYDESQTNDEIRDGDVLVAEEDGETILAILVKAWPTLVWPAAPCHFHELKPGLTWQSLDDGKYAPSFEAAKEWWSSNL
jgi:hypothetical protein